MIDLKRRSGMGDSAEEYLQTLPYETDSDGECIWRIVPAGESFGFEGEQLTEFVRLSVLRLLESGAIPVRYAEEGVDSLLRDKTRKPGRSPLAKVLELPCWQRDTLDRTRR